MPEGVQTAIDGREANGERAVTTARAGFTKRTDTSIPFTPQSPV